MHWIVVGGLAAGLVAMSSAGWRFFVHPLSSDTDDAIAAKADLDGKLQKARETAAQFDMFKAKSENKRRDLEFYSSRTDENLSYIEVSRMMDLMGNELNLKDWTVSVNPPGPSTGNGVDIGACKVEVRFKSDYDHMGRFLNSCLGQRRLIVPDNVSLHYLDDATGSYSDTVDVDLFLTVYGGKAKGKS